MLYISASLLSMSPGSSGGRGEKDKHATYSVDLFIFFLNVLNVPFQMSQESMDII